MKQYYINIIPNRLISGAASLVRLIREHGFDCRLVGGVVRDMILGEEIKDADLVTTATPDELLTFLPEAKKVGVCFGVLIVRHEGFDFEVASARRERFYMDGRHPEEVQYTRDLSADVSRRDFTINSLLLDPESGEITDFTGGTDDLANRVLRTVGNPEQRFEEDYLRMLRAIRFAGRLNLEIEEKTFSAIKKLAHKTALLAPERVGDELTAMLCGRHAEKTFGLLLESGILNTVLPEVAELKGVEQEKTFHPEGDVWTHTLIMLSLLHAPDPDLAWAVLLHDVGKKRCFSRDPDTGRIRAFGHEKAGEIMSREIMGRFRFSNARIQRVSTAIANHMRFANVREMRVAKLKQMIGAETFPLEIELHRLDCFSSHRIMDVYLYLLDFVAAQRGVTRLPEPYVRGADLIAAGMKPGPEFSPLLADYYERQLSGEFSSPEAARSDLIASLARKQPNTAGR